MRTLALSCCMFALPSLCFAYNGQIINRQVTDAVTQANVKVVADGAARVMGNQYLYLAAPQCTPPDFSQQRTTPNMIEYRIQADQRFCTCVDKLSSGEISEPIRQLARLHC